MHDREPTYPGRVTMTPVFGQENTYDMERADKPLQLGTPLNKATLLKDATAALYGLGTGAVPDDVLGVLSRFQAGLGNEYVWEKIKKIYTVSEKAWSGNGQANFGQQNYYPITIRYSNGVLNNEGTITLADPVSSITLASYSEHTKLNTLKGKYVEITPTIIGFDGNSNIFPGVGVYLIQSFDSTGSNSTWGYAYILKPSGKKCEAIQETQSFGYVNSPDLNAYPPAVSDGYIYTALGQLGSKVQIEIGSYVGTGTYGTANPNTLTFGFVPKLVIVCKKNGFLTPSDGGYNQSFLWVARQFVLSIYAVNSISFVSISANGNTLSWYADSPYGPERQCNISGQEYNYIAIG